MSHSASLLESYDKVESFKKRFLLLVLMYETKADLVNFKQLASMPQAGLALDDLAVLNDPWVEELFSFKTNHPMGYVDGASSVPYDEVAAVADLLSDDKKKELLNIAQKLVKKDTLTSFNLDQRCTILLGANQIAQPYSYTGRWHEAKSTLAKIVEAYESSGVKIKQWDAQMHENKSFVHMEEVNFLSVFPMFCQVTLSTVAAGAALSAVTGSRVYLDVAVNGMAISAGIMFAGYAVNMSALALQGMGKSPNFTESLINKRHYRFTRHPLYATRAVSTFFASLATLNPLGWYYGAKVLYHGAKACEEQDMRMKVLHGSEAANYQETVPVLVPGSKKALSILKKWLPKRMTVILETPVQEYLKKLPGITKTLDGLKTYNGPPNGYVKVKKPYEDRTLINSSIAEAIV